MVNIPPNTHWPMFRVGQPEDPPGFRVSDDGSTGATSGDFGLASFGRDLYGNAAPAAGIDSISVTDPSGGAVYPAADSAYDPVDGNNPSWQARARWTPNQGEPLYVNARDDRPGFVERFAPFLNDVQDAAEAVGTKANAVVNGAYSVFPGTYNAIRAVGRGIGLLGPEEFRRVGQEADFIGGSLGEIAKHPGLAFRIAREAVPIVARDPLLPYYAAGRFLMGGLTRLGRAATMGDALRAIENGHNLFNSVFYHGIKASLLRALSMVSGKLRQLLQSSRWRPYFLGVLGSLPVTAVMLLAWIYCDVMAIAWLVLYGFLGGLGVFWKTPTRKLISAALLFGTLFRS